MTSPTGNPRSDAPGRAAFTLIELILVMALLVIVIAVAAPSLANFFRGRTIDSEARQLVSLARYGQSRAVSEGVPMVLWLDTKRGTYGLRQETGYTTEDLKAVEFTLGQDLRVSVGDAATPTTPMARARTARSADPNVATLRFQPDGFIDETSPQTVVLRDESASTIWITQSRNRLNYEISTNQFPVALR